MSLDILETSCSCEKCSFMCHAPCCGTPEDMKKLMDAGYAKKLMLDDLPGGEDMLKPALKGYEGMKSPWDVASKSGCTFWINGMCELHSSGLKPSQGKLAHHSLNKEQNDKIGEAMNDSWEGGKGDDIIEQWKEENGRNKMDDEFFQIVENLSPLSDPQLEVLSQTIADAIRKLGEQIKEKYSSPMQGDKGE